MKLVKCIIRESKVDETTDALKGLDVSGVTVTIVAGSGRQRPPKEFYRCTEYEPRYARRMMIDVVVAEHVLNEVIRIVMEAAHTGRPGDGRVFVIPVEEAYTIRTQASGPD